MQLWQCRDASISLSPGPSLILRPHQCRMMPIVWCSESKRKLHSFTGRTREGTTTTECSEHPTEEKPRHRRPENVVEQQPDRKTSIAQGSTLVNSPPMSHPRVPPEDHPVQRCGIYNSLPFSATESHGKAPAYGQRSGMGPWVHDGVRGTEHGCALATTGIRSSATLSSARLLSFNACRLNIDQFQCAMTSPKSADPIQLSLGPNRPRLVICACNVTTWLSGESLL